MSRQLRLAAIIGRFGVGFALKLCGLVSSVECDLDILEDRSERVSFVEM